MIFEEFYKDLEDLTFPTTIIMLSFCWHMCSQMLHTGNINKKCETMWHSSQSNFISMIQFNFITMITMQSWLKGNLLCSRHDMNLKAMKNADHIMLFVVSVLLNTVQVWTADMGSNEIIKYKYNINICLDKTTNTNSTANKRNLSVPNTNTNTYVQIQIKYKYILVRIQCLFCFHLQMCHLIFPIAAELTGFQTISLYLNTYLHFMRR